jgi:hypothetical protein
MKGNEDSEIAEICRMADKMKIWQITKTAAANTLPCHKQKSPNEKNLAQAFYTHSST